MINGQYTVIAQFYDKLNSGVDYAGYAKFIDHVIKSNFADAESRSQMVADLGCGTGNITLELERLGYDMIGIDSSEEMLSIAESKRQLSEVSSHRNGENKILWLQQDIRSFELYGTVDAAVSCLDSINYLMDKDSLRDCFEKVHNYLNPQGIFIFDLNTPYKFKNVYGNRDYILEAEGVYCGWSNYYNEKSGVCRFELSFFAENEDGTYYRCDELQRERCYSKRTIDKLLAESGFDIIAVVSDFDMTEPCDECERWYYICRKK